MLQEKLVKNYNENRGPLSNNDFDFIDFVEWKGLINALYDVSKNIYIRLRNREISNLELEKDEQYVNLMQALTKLFNIIGKVNDFELSEKWSFGRVIISYFFSLIRENREIRRDSFRLKIEKYLARKILVQRSIPKQLLIAENDDKGLVRSLNAHLRRLIQEEANQNINVVTNNEKRITYADILVKTYALRCIHRHNIVQVQAVIEIIDFNGRKRTVSIPAAYCENCSCFFVLDSDYQRIRQQGVLLCRLLKEEDFREHGNEILDGTTLRPESLLHQCGYNVNATVNLSESQRHEILRQVIDNNLYSLIGLCSHFDWLIDRARRQPGDMAAAISKWQTDREYIVNYTLHTHTQVRAN